MDQFFEGGAGLSVRKFCGRRFGRISINSSWSPNDPTRLSDTSFRLVFIISKS